MSVSSHFPPPPLSETICDARDVKNVLKLLKLTGASQVLVQNRFRKFLNIFSYSLRYGELGNLSLVRR